MGVLNLTATMDGLAASITASTLVPNVYAWPVESVTVPCALIDYPSEIELGTTMQRGADHVVLPIYYLVGVTGTKDARDALSAAMTGAGDLVAVIEGTYSFGDVDVTSADVAQATVGAVTYIGLKFTVDVLP